MNYELGNPSPILPQGETRDGPCVTYGYIPESYTFTDGLGVADFKTHLTDSLLMRGNVTSLPDNEAALVVAHPDGAWGRHSTGRPSWALSDSPGFQRFLSEFYQCPEGRPSDVEETHYALAGPPGVVPNAAVDLQGNITQNGRDMWARALGGGQVGSTGQATASGSTSLTNSGATWTTNQWQGSTVYASVSATQMVFGQITANTATALTVDQWYTVATPGGAVGSTPSSTATYVIIQGNSPAWFMGISTSTTALANPSTNTSLPSEITTVGGGLIRKICPYAHTASTNTYTLTPVFTANGSDSLPVTIGSIGVFDSMVVANSTSTMLFNTLLGTTATLSASGDQLTITETVTGT